jgi:ribosomal protein L19
MMNRAVVVAVLIGGLLVGYAAGGSRLEAQGQARGTASADFPFAVGDTVNVLFEVEDRGGDLCVIDNFRGPFVMCKNDNGVQFAFNSLKVVKVRQVRAAQ